MISFILLIVPGTNTAALWEAIILALKKKMSRQEKKEKSFYSTRGNHLNSQAGIKAIESLKRHMLSSSNSKFNVEDGGYAQEEEELIYYEHYH